MRLNLDERSHKVLTSVPNSRFTISAERPSTENLCFGTILFAEREEASPQFNSHTSFRNTLTSTHQEIALTQHIQVKTDKMWQSLARTITTISAINEVTLIFSTWILSSSPSTIEPSLRNYIPPTICVLLYAISEPFYTKLLLYIPLRPFVAVIGTSQIHILLSTLFIQAVNSILASEPQNPESSSEKGESSAKPLETEVDRNSRFGFAQVLFVLQIHSAAAMNASLQILAQSLASKTPGEEVISDCLAVFSFVIWLASRLGDRFTTLATGKAGYIGQHGRGEACSQVANLGLLLLVKTKLRTVLGFASWSFMEVIDETRREDWFGSTRFQSAEDFFRRTPTWLPPVMSVLAMILMVAGEILKRRSRQAV